MGSEGLIIEMYRLLSRLFTGYIAQHSADRPVCALKSSMTCYYEPTLASSPAANLASRAVPAAALFLFLTLSNSRAKFSLSKSATNFLLFAAS
jgi:hypothetical protein